MIEIKESTYDDIKNIQGLWADAECDLGMKLLLSKEKK